jgi:hypothetical protein
MLCSGYKCGAALLLLCAALAGCAGNGEGLDANGQPIGSSSSSSSSGGASGSSGSGGVTADFQSIQDNVFTPICSVCHIGASAPHGLQLDAGHSYALLVGVPSDEEPNVLRVKPGDPDNSYLYQKITDASGIVGGQMPLDEMPLPAATIAAIRQWILNGAPNATSTSGPLTAKLELNRAPASDAFAVTQTAPLDGDEIEAPLNTIVVALNHEVDASLVNYTTVTLERLVDGRALPVAASASLAVSNPSSIVIRPTAGLTPGNYRVNVRGTGGGALADIGAQALGTDYSFVFTVSPAK